MTQAVHRYDCRYPALMSSGLVDGGSSRYLTAAAHRMDVTRSPGDDLVTAHSPGIVIVCVAVPLE